MSWKYFIENKHTIANSGELCKEFPGHTFLNGHYKGKEGVFAIKDPETKKYGKSKPSVCMRGVHFFPASENNEPKLEDYEKKELDRIELKLDYGQIVKLVPAYALPQKVVFSVDGFVFDNGDDEEEIQYAKNFNKKLEYGKAAYDMIYFLDKQNINFNDPKFIKLIILCFQESYDLPFDVIHELIDFSGKNDFSKICGVALGYNMEIKKKEN